MKLENKTAVVTGASSGMGKAIVEKFVREGASVVAVARREEKLKDLADSLSGAPGKIVLFPGDVSQKEKAEEMINQAVREFGALDILVNNAGVMDSMAGVGNLTDERFEQVMKVNVWGLLYAMRKAVNYFLDSRKTGTIINMSSLSAWHTTGGAVYSASKAAVIGLTQDTAVRYGNRGIRCNAVAPGSITTHITSSMGKPDMAGLMRIRKVLSGRPKKSGSAENAADLVLFLASEDSAAVNGAVIPLDGGWDAM